MRILKERRDIVGWYWFDKMTPFDRFSVEHVSEGHKLVFADLAAEANLVDPEERLYRYSLKGNGIDSSKNIEFGPNTRFPLALDHLAGRRILRNQFTIPFN